MLNNYHNTTFESGQMLMDFTNKAGAQDIIILDLFQEARKPLTAWEALQLLEARGQKILITSVRRSINTLCRNSLLVNTGEKIMDVYNRPTFKFKLNN